MLRSLRNSNYDTFQFPAYIPQPLSLTTSAASAVPGNCRRRLCSGMGQARTAGVQVPRNIPQRTIQLLCIVERVTLRNFSRISLKDHTPVTHMTFICYPLCCFPFLAPLLFLTSLLLFPTSLSRTFLINPFHLNPCLSLHMEECKLIYKHFVFCL